MSKNLKRIILIVLSVIIVLFSVAIAGIYIYSLDYYKADDIANSLLNLENIKQEDDIISISSDNSDIGIIFYPGAKVEYISYLPILEKLSQKGYNCFLPKMPLNFAFLGKNIADNIINDNPQIKTWYMAGHSLGGAIASGYTADNLDKIEGLILLGAYIYKDVPYDKAIVIYGSNDLILDKTKLYGRENEIELDGGNHAMFGNYGEQKGDGKAEISREEQQQKTIYLIDDFIKQNNF